MAHGRAGRHTWKSRCLEMPAKTLLVFRAWAISSSSGDACICMALHERCLVSTPARCSRLPPLKLAWTLLSAAVSAGGG